MPFEITERLWNSPGPNQGEPGAPKLLIVYPLPLTRLEFEQKRTRYAGRVEPMSAEVLLDGKPIKVYPEGVFTGLLKAPIGTREIIFKASDDGRSTLVKRTIYREARAIGPPSRPLQFHPISPLQPEGALEYWLRPGSKLKIRLRGSPGHKASMRVGESGSWLSMKKVRAKPEEGGAYEGVLVMDDAISIAELQPLQFRLAAKRSGSNPARTITMTSQLKVKRLPAGAKYSGIVEKYLATFLKKEEGWDRWGNWIVGTPFVVEEKRGERIRVNFGRGDDGYVETESVCLNAEPSEAPMPALGRPEIQFEEPASSGRMTVEWKVGRPIAHVFDPGGAMSEKLRVSLMGAASAEAILVKGPAGGFFRSVEVTDGSRRRPPEVRVVLKGRELWGYGFEMIGKDKLRLTVRARPDAPSPEKGRPLGGFKIMVDAGHGGHDLSALGPSGLCESDVNLVMAAYLGRKLERLGATVRQVRTDDTFVDLDDRVGAALQWPPDLFISVHNNSVGLAVSPTIDQGPKVYYHYPHAAEMADSVARQLTDLLMQGARPRTHTEVFRVMRNISPCPSILIEGGFLCNPADEIKLRNSKMIEAMAAAAAQGVLGLMAHGDGGENEH